MMAPNSSLTTLDCESCGYIGEPTLHRLRDDAGHWGAYCGRCKRFLKWVPHNTIWTAAFEAQAANAAQQTAIAAGAPITSQEETWILAIASMGQFCFDQAEAMGWHSKPRSTLERAMLVVTELAELSEAARHNQLASPSEHIPEFTAAEEEWADVLVRVFDHAPDDGVTPERLGRAFVAKLAYNRTRGYKHGGKTI